MLETLYSIVRLLLEWVLILKCMGRRWCSLIANTVHAVFGDSATYLLDFYHFEYLASASVVCALTQPDVFNSNSNTLNVMGGNKC